MGLRKVTQASKGHNLWSTHVMAFDFTKRFISAHEDSAFRGTDLAKAEYLNTSSTVTELVVSWQVFAELGQVAPQEGDTVSITFNDLSSWYLLGVVWSYFLI